MIKIDDNVKIYPKVYDLIHIVYPYDDLYYKSRETIYKVIIITNIKIGINPISGGGKGLDGKPYDVIPRFLIKDLWIDGDLEKTFFLDEVDYKNPNPTIIYYKI